MAGSNTPNAASTTTCGATSVNTMMQQLHQQAGAAHSTDKTVVRRLLALCRIPSSSSSSGPAAPASLDAMLAPAEAKAKQLCQERLRRRTTPPSADSFQAYGYYGGYNTGPGVLMARATADRHINSVGLPSAELDRLLRADVGGGGAAAVLEHCAQAGYIYLLKDLVGHLQVKSVRSSSKYGSPYSYHYQDSNVLRDLAELRLLTGPANTLLPWVLADIETMGRVVQLALQGRCAIALPDARGRTLLHQLLAISAGFIPPSLCNPAVRCMAVADSEQSAAAAASPPNTKVLAAAQPQPTSPSSPTSAAAGPAAGAAAAASSSTTQDTDMADIYVPARTFRTAVLSGMLHFDPTCVQEVLHEVLRADNTADYARPAEGQVTPLMMAALAPLGADTGNVYGGGWQLQNYSVQYSGAMRQMYPRLGNSPALEAIDAGGRGVLFYLLHSDSPEADVHAWMREMLGRADAARLVEAGAGPFALMLSAISANHWAHTPRTEAASDQMPGDPWLPPMPADVASPAADPLATVAASVLKARCFNAAALLRVLFASRQGEIFVRAAREGRTAAGSTLLMEAARRNQYASCLVLLDKAGVDIDAVDAAGRSALDHASTERIQQLLLREGAWHSEAQCRDIEHESWMRHRCSRCHAVLSRTAFSKQQRRISTSKRRCLFCVHTDEQRQRAEKGTAEANIRPLRELAGLAVLTAHCARVRPSGSARAPTLPPQISAILHTLASRGTLIDTTQV